MITIIIFLRAEYSNLPRGGKHIAQGGTANFPT